MERKKIKIKKWNLINKYDVNDDEKEKKERERKKNEECSFSPPFSHIFSL